MDEYKDDRKIKLQPLEEKAPAVEEAKMAPKPKKGKSEKQRKHLEKARATRVKKSKQKKMLKKVEEKLMSSDVTTEAEFMDMLEQMFVRNDNQLQTPAHKQTVLDMRKDDVVSPRNEYRANESRTTYEESVSEIIMKQKPNISSGFMSIEDPLNQFGSKYDVML